MAAMLILALDVMDETKAMEIAEVTARHIQGIKVNYPLVLSCGIEIIEELSGVKPVIADFKIADIPYTSALIADLAFSHGASGIIVHGFAGSDTVSEVKRVADEYSGEVYTVTELSSRGGEEFMSRHAYEIVEIAKRAGVDGLIAPATRAERIREIRRRARNLKILCPGVIAQGGSVEEAIKSGADGIIVGRAIYSSSDPEREAERISRLVQTFLKKYK